MCQLSNAAFEFGHRDRKWNFTLDAFEGVKIQEYWHEDMGGEESIKLYKGECGSFGSFEHFIASVSVIQFEDSYPLVQHCEEFAKINLQSRSHGRFVSEWNGRIPLKRKMPPCPDLVGSVYQSREAWDWVTYVAQSHNEFYAYEWATSG